MAIVLELQNKCQLHIIDEREKFPIPHSSRRLNPEEPHFTFRKRTESAKMARIIDDFVKSSGCSVLAASLGS
ncbi:MAG: hypothetical protein QMD32_02375, partial [Smithellaceae bacterium]|nr:hypothetical protein [Smithellaceae bacterium]